MGLITESATVLEFICLVLAEDVNLLKHIKIKVYRSIFKSRCHMIGFPNCLRGGLETLARREAGEYSL